MFYDIYVLYNKKVSSKMLDSKQKRLGTYNFGKTKEKEKEVNLSDEQTERLHSDVKERVISNVNKR